MRSRFLFVTAALLLSVNAVCMAEKTAYAVLCKANKTFYFTYTDELLAVDGTYKGQTIDEIWKDDETNKPITESPVSSEPAWRTSLANYATKVVFDESFKEVTPNSCNKWFYSCDKLTTIEGIENLNTSGVVDMDYMFNKCKVLTTLDLSSFNTAAVTTMESMFEDCPALETITFGTNFNTGSVTSMYGMFSGCSALTALDLSGFNTEKVQIMTDMFANCSALATLTLGDGFVSTKVTKMDWMFYNCGALTSLTFGSGFKADKVEGMGMMFKDCSSLKTLDLSSFTTTAATGMSSMFNGCSSLETLDISGFKTNNVTDMSNMFSGCSALATLTLGDGFVSTNVNNMISMFHNCKALTSLTFGSGFTADNVTNMDRMFSGCSALTALDLGGFKTEGVTNMFGMFDGCSGLKELHIDNFSVNDDTETYDMFYGCKAIMLLDMRNVTTGLEKIAKDEVFNKTGMTLIIPSEEAKANVYTTENNIVIPGSGTTFTRSFTAGNMSTVCLPYAVNISAEDGTFYKYSRCTADEVIFDEVKDGTTEAGTAYLFKPAATGDVTFTSTEELTTLPTATEEAGDGLYGVYETKTFTEDEALAKTYYGWAGGKFMRAGKGATVKPNRAYLKVSAATPSSFMVKLSDEITGISSVTTTENNDNMPLYNLQGMCVDDNYEGIVIRGGKKIILRKR